MCAFDIHGFAISRYLHITYTLIYVVEEEPGLRFPGSHCVAKCLERHTTRYTTCGIPHTTIPLILIADYGNSLLLLIPKVILFGVL